MTFGQMFTPLRGFNRIQRSEFDISANKVSKCCSFARNELARPSAWDNRYLRLPGYYVCLLLLFVMSGMHPVANAQTNSKQEAVKAVIQTKKSPEATFLTGKTCLEQQDIACAKVALATIPSVSPYAKLLQGGIAVSEHAIDNALQWLLPLQSNTELIPEASNALHLYLATVFEQLDDIQQTVAHLIQAETGLKSEEASKAENSRQAIHERIWNKLNHLQHAELTQLRGNTTDNIAQGWIDLALAARSQDTQANLQWRTFYPDHPALTFAQGLAAAKTTAAPLKAQLASNGSIALILPLAVGTPHPIAEAFKAGLQAALTNQALANKINIYPATENQQDIDDVYTLAKSEGNAYFIIPSFSSEEAIAHQVRLTETGNVIQVGSMADDEALHIAAYAASHRMQRITVVTVENATFKQLVNSFEAAWQSHPGYMPDIDTISVVTLPEQPSANDSNLLNLKAQIEEKNPDMILLALPAALARTVRPHLPMRIPTMTFSNTNEHSTDTASYSTMNAVRFFDIPFLINKDAAFDEEYKKRAVTLGSNTLSRWFALGADSLQLLIAAETLSDREISIPGLTGTLTINSMGSIQRHLPLARFTHNGVIMEP